MTEEVLVSVRGLQMTPDDQDEVELVTSGKYLKKGDKHYITYDEMIEGMDGKITNLIKLDGSAMEVTKKGLTNVHMIFEKDKKNMTCYNTPFGDLMVGIAATNIDVNAGEENIDIEVRYVLDLNYEHMADCTINMNIKSKNGKEFHLN